MNKKSMYSFLLIASLLGLLSSSVRIQNVYAPYLIITIEADGSISPTPVNIATSDNITYTFTADINASIIVQRSDIVIDGDGWTLGGNDYAIIYGLNLTEVSNVTIRNLNVMGFGYGIYLQSSTLNIIMNNNITFNEGNIYLEYSYNNTITGNTITNGAEAVQLLASSDNTISGNSMSYNHNGVWSRLDSAENVISGNEITENYNNGIFLDSSSNNTIHGNEIANQISNGISVSNSSNNIITKNIITSNHFGIWVLSLSWYNTVNRNHIDSNNNGINVQMSHDNTFVSNNITRNSGYGVFLSAQIYGNTLYHNNFIGNTQHADTITTLKSEHIWDNGYPSGGNYWSNYTGADSNHDGIGDIPHVIDANNTDYNPLVGMFHSFNTSLGKSVNVISNSTVDSFQYELPATIRFHVSNQTASQTHGFCRVSIPYDVLSEPFKVTIDGANPTYWNYTLYDNGTHRWIYFEYEHSTKEVIIIPEFSLFLILPLFMMATLLAALAHRRRQTSKPQKFPFS